MKNPAPPSLVASLRALTAGALGMAVLLSLAAAAGHDQLWFLLMSRRWLAGATLYGPEIFDSNPPLVVWLSALPVELGRLLPLPAHDPATAWAKLLVVLVAAAVLLLCRRLLLPSIGKLFPADNALLLFAFVVIVGVLPARDFGQRDQLTGLLCLPYVLAAGASALPPHSGKDSRDLRLAVALSTLFAAVGICLKPQQALLALAVEATLLLLWWQERRGRPRLIDPPSHPLRRVTPWFLLTAGVAYVGAVRLFAPAYLAVALPLLRETYWAIGHLNTAQLIREAPELHLLALLTLTVFAWQRRLPAASVALPASRLSPGPHPHSLPFSSSPLRSITLLLLAAGLGSTLAYHLQGTGWYYQQLPAFSFFAAALALELLPPLRRVRSAPPLLPACALLLSIVAVVLTGWFSRTALRAPAGIEVLSPEPAFFAALPSGAPVAILTTSVEDSMMPVERFGLTWSQRTNNLWLLPAALRLEDPSPGLLPRPARRVRPEQAAALDALIHRWMVEDLTRWRPVLVLVARCQDPRVHCQELEGRHDDLLAWLSRDPGFRTVWQRYRFERAAGGYDAWRLQPPSMPTAP